MELEIRSYTSACLVFAVGLLLLVNWSSHLLQIATASIYYLIYAEFVSDFDVLLPVNSW